MPTSRRLDAANFGIGGDTTDNLLYRVENGDLAGDPRVAVVMIGINDLFGGASPEQAASGIASVVHAIQARSPDTKVLLLGVLPTSMVPLNAEVAQTDALISGMGREPGVSYLDLQGRFLGDDGAARVGFLMDAAHPSPAGYQAIAGAIDATILGLLKPNQAISAPAPTAPAPAAQEPAVEIPRAPTAVEGRASASVASSAPADIPIPAASDPGVLLFLVDPEAPTNHHKPTAIGQVVGPGLDAVPVSPRT